MRVPEMLLSTWMLRSTWPLMTLRAAAVVPPTVLLLAEPPMMMPA